jgi:hypothetical protein
MRPVVALTPPFSAFGFKNFTPGEYRAQPAAVPTYLWPMHLPYAKVVKFGRKLQKSKKIFTAAAMPKYS